MLRCMGLGLYEGNHPAPVLPFFMGYWQGVNGVTYLKGENPLHVDLEPARAML
jgi:hypothetical protein